MKFKRDLNHFIASLSGRLMLITLGFVLIVEIIILIPSMASFQYNWLSDRIAKAEIASLAIDASSDKTVSKDFSQQLLNSAGVNYLAIQNDGVRDIVLRDPNIIVPEYVVDLRRTHDSLDQDVRYLWGPWKTLLSEKSKLIHYQARPRVRKGELIEVVVPIDALKFDLLTYLLSILRVSLGISIAAGLVVFYALLFSIVRPIENLTQSISRFRQDPEDTSLKPIASGRIDEIGQIEDELISMQDEVRNALKSKARLVALGQAVSKINHDLRNMLTSAQMASDRLALSGDPAVTKALPRLERALDRALNLAQNVLNYGRFDERPPQLHNLRLKDLALNAAEDAGLELSKASPQSVKFILKIPRGFSIEADPDHMHRLLVNLMRNARQAIELQPARKTTIAGAKPNLAQGKVTLEARKTDDEVIIRIIDNGPGIPQKLKDKLFQPFTGTLTPGGAGLGLAISRELAQLHGGDVQLASTGIEGTCFEIKLPLKA